MKNIRFWTKTTTTNEEERKINLKGKSEENTNFCCCCRLGFLYSFLSSSILFINLFMFVGFSAILTASKLVDSSSCLFFVLFFSRVDSSPFLFLCVFCCFLFFFVDGPRTHSNLSVHLFSVSMCMSVWQCCCCWFFFDFFILWKLRFYFFSSLFPNQ